MLQSRLRFLVLATLIALLSSGQAAQPRSQADADWSTITLGRSQSRLAPTLTAKDVERARPPASGTVNAPILGYAHRWKPEPPAAELSRVSRPLESPFDSDDPRWWDSQLEQLLYARAPLALLSARGCRRPDDPNAFEGNGGMCPYKLRMMNEAVRRAGAEKAIKFAMFVDTAGPVSARRALSRARDQDRQAPADERFIFDLRPIPDAAGHAPTWYFWDGMIRPWFDTVSREFWYTIRDGGQAKPVIVFWGIGHRFLNQAGNASALLDELRTLFAERYGVEPFFIVSDSWITTDPALAAGTLAGGVHSWFNPRLGTATSSGAVKEWAENKWRWIGTPNGYSSLTAWRGRKWGVAVVGFNCGPACRVPVLPRDEGVHFRDVLTFNREAAINMIEGFNGPLEGTALFRSIEPDWAFPNQYLEILRRSSDPASAAIRFEAIAADDRSGDARISGGGERLLDVEAPGRAFTFRKVLFAGGRYRVTLRATGGQHPASFSVRIGTAAAAATVPAAEHGAPDLAIADLGTIELRAGEADVTVSAGEADARIDWLDLRKIP